MHKRTLSNFIAHQHHLLSEFYLSQLSRYIEDASRESEKRMLESLVLQTKQLELTKISLEEARIEMTSLQETVQKLEASGPVVTPRGRYDRDLQRVHGELLLALAAEEKSKKAMEELVPAHKELNAELHATRQQLARAARGADGPARVRPIARVAQAQGRQAPRPVRRGGPASGRRRGVVRRVAAWRGKEAGFTACMKSTEAELTEARRENARLLESQRSGRDEITKLRDILKQAVKDTKFVEEALEESRSENALLKEMVGNKDNAVKCTKQELECLRVSEAAARDSVKELQSLLVATSSSPTAAGKLNLEDTSSPQSAIDLPGLDKYPSEAKMKPPAGLARPRRMSENFEGSVYDIFGSMDDQKGELGVFSTMPRLPGRRRVVMRKVGSLFRWKSFSNK